MALPPLAPASHEDLPVDVPAGPSGFSGPDYFDGNSLRTRYSPGFRLRHNADGLCLALENNSLEEAKVSNGNCLHSRPALCCRFGYQFRRDREWDYRVAIQAVIVQESIVSGIEFAYEFDPGFAA